VLVSTAEPTGVLATRRVASRRALAAVFAGDLVLKLDAAQLGRHARRRPAQPRTRRCGSYQESPSVAASSFESDSHARRHSAS